MPDFARCHPSKIELSRCTGQLQGYLYAYLEIIGDDRKSPLFRTIQRGTGDPSNTTLPQANAYAMVRRRALAARIDMRSATTRFAQPASRHARERRGHGESRVDANGAGL
jgi:hypothetical protein